MPPTIRRLCEILREQNSEAISADNSDTDNTSSTPLSEELKEWERFEERVKHIYDALLNINREKVAVSRDVKLKGHDGLVHQFDVYYEFSRAGVSHRVAIECKDKSRPIDKDAVMAFRGKVFDVLGLQGVMVSAKGYQSGAKKYAEDNGIIAITMEQLPHVGELLAMRLERNVLPDDESVGEPFWSIYEVENGKPNGNLWCESVSGWYDVVLFYSKSLAVKFLSTKPSSIQARYSVRGLTQTLLKSFIMIADTHRSNYLLILDVKPKNMIGMVQISRSDLIADYVLDAGSLPKEPMVIPSLADKSKRS